MRKKAQNPEGTNETKRGSELINVDPRNIRVVEGFNCRRDMGDMETLKNSIREHGVLQPVSLIPYVEDGVELYRLVNGERRYRATMALIEEGVEILRIPAKIETHITSEADLLIRQILYNDGKSFNEYEEALIYSGLLKHGMIQAEIAQKLGRNPAAISRALTLLDAPTKTQKLAQKGLISTSVVIAIMQYTPDTAKQEKLADEAIEKANKRGKKTATKKDLDPAVTMADDSKLILKGVKLMLNYGEKAGMEEIDIYRLVALLEEGKQVDEAFDTMKAEDVELAPVESKVG